MRKVLAVILITITTIPIFGQGGFFSKDSTKFMGVRVIKMGRFSAYFCSVKIGNDIIKYTPFEVHEYGNNQGQEYKAFDIVIDGQKERYFFEHLAKGNLNLYNLRLKGGITKQYILPADSSKLRELPARKDELQFLIGAFVDNCPQAAQNLKHLKPNKYSLKRYVNYLNSCSDYPYPEVQYGFKIGIEGTHFYPLDQRSDYALADYNSDISLTIGVFIDLPVFSSNLSFSPEMYFKGNHYSKSFSTSLESFNLVLNYSSLNFPLLFKYRFLKKGIIPFIELGPVYSRLLKNEATLYTYDIVDSEIYTEINNSPVIQKNMGGFSLGGGIISASVGRLRLLAEVRYNYMFNLNPENKNFNLGGFSLNTGIIF